MAKSISMLILLVTCGVAARAEDEPKSAVVKTKAGEIVAAIKKEEYAKVVDLTYPKLVELVGGRERMLAELEASMKQLKQKGYSFKSIEVGEPGEILTEGKNTFAVVPTTTEMAAPEGKIVLESYLLGISSDGGKTWTFVDGNGISAAEKRDLILPKLPAKLELPARMRPKSSRTIDSATVASRCGSRGRVPVPPTGQRPCNSATRASAP